MSGIELRLTGECMAVDQRHQTWKFASDSNIERDYDPDIFRAGGGEGDYNHRRGPYNGDDYAEDYDWWRATRMIDCSYEKDGG